MFRTIAACVPRDTDLPERAWTLDVLRRVLDGTVYDTLPHEYHEERAPSGEYIPVARRAPSVRSNLCATVIADQVSLLFGEGRFPAAETGNATANEVLADLIKGTRISQRMTQAAMRGSIGSVALFLRVVRATPCVDVLDTLFLTPTFRDDSPDTLARVIETYKQRGRQLAALFGYDIAADEREQLFWFRREWTDQEETWFLPQRATDRADGKPPVVDIARSVRHGFGFVPLVWVRNPGVSVTGASCDGGCGFRAGVETVMALDYLMSAGHRAQMYMGSPRITVSGLVPDQQIGPADMIITGDGDAKLLEIDGGSTEATLAMAMRLREQALEAMRGNRSSADKLTAAQSGRALELMHQPLIWAADELRVTYGEGALIDLLTMITRASQVMPIRLVDYAAPIRLPTLPIALRWTHWFSSTHEDLRAQATTVKTLTESSLMSRRTALSTIGPDYDIEDIDAELSEIAADQDAMDRRAAKQAATINATEQIPA